MEFVDTTQLTAVEIAAAVQDGRLTARQATEQALQRIEDRDTAIGAFQEVRAFSALDEADAVDAHSDKASLPLAGVPVAVKDNVPVTGAPMRLGSLGSSDTPQTSDHIVVHRLRAAGAVIVGITRMPELALWPTCDSEFGVTRNPWDLERTPGGSSGGAAAAVAAGMIPLAHGNDGLGSIRIPSACCGLVGIKPGRGVVPSELGGESWFGLAENGPIATSVADAALTLSVLADRPVLAHPSSPAALRVAVSTKAPPLPGVKVAAHWAAAAEETGQLLATLGHTVTEADPPYSQKLGRTATKYWLAGAAVTIGDLADPTEAARRTRAHARLGRTILAAGGPREGGRRRWQRRVSRFFADHDVLITPTLATDPIEAAGWAGRGWAANVRASIAYAPFAAAWNVAGWPAIAVPAGVSASGLPLSAQLVARPGEESTLLALAASLEKLRPWPRVAPPR